MSHVNYFLGANTPDGFYSLFNELYDPYSDWQMYILKGGPGTGKSTILKSIAAKADNYGYFTEYINCSSDPDSLDAVIIPELKISVADGTSPHIINPLFPGVCEHTVDLSTCWNTDILKTDTSKIKMITMTNSAAHKKAVKYIKAARLLDNEIKSYTIPSVNTEKIKRLAKRMTDTYFRIENDHQTIKNRFLSAISPEGIVLHKNTINYYCDNIITIKDNYNISYLLINELIKQSEINKLNIIICRCPINPTEKVNHIIFPDIRTGFFTVNDYYTIKGQKIINTSRFIDKNMLSKNKNSIMFLKKAEAELITEAIESVKTAKSAHDILENYYINAMDFDKVNDIRNELIKKIFR